jgi:tRNA-2-methylthio-N6-dimethylallyladenosine synthase
MQAVHAEAPDRLLGRIVPVRILEGHANSLSGAVVTADEPGNPADRAIPPAATERAIA